MPTISFEGVQIEAPEGVGVTFEGGKLCLAFTDFTGSVCITPRQGSSPALLAAAKADTTPLDRPVPESGTLFKRQRTASAVASDSSNDASGACSAGSHEGNDSDGVVLVPPVFPNGGLSQVCSGSDFAPPTCPLTGVTYLVTDHVVHQIRCHLRFR